MWSVVRPTRIPSRDRRWNHPLPRCSSVRLPALFLTLCGMELRLDPHPSFTPRPGPLLLVVADGVGVAPPAESNAVTQAHTPVLDDLLASELSTELAAHGTAVGLPSDDDMGNSEVGHNAIGCGPGVRAGRRASSRRGIAEWANLFETETCGARRSTRPAGATLHLMGLVSVTATCTAHLRSPRGDLASTGPRRMGVTRAPHPCPAPMAATSAARSALTLPRHALEGALAVINAEHAENGRDYRIASGGGRMHDHHGPLRGGLGDGGSRVAVPRATATGCSPWVRLRHRGGPRPSTRPRPTYR